MSVSFNKLLWPIYILGGFQSLAYSSFFILIVPLSSVIWPNEPFHAFEMSLIITIMLWTSSISGIVFGRLIDKHSRKRILVLISFFRAACLILLSFVPEGLGFQTWIYFFILTLIFAIFAGGSYPAIVSLAYDTVRKEERSQFFGIFGVINSIFTLFGFLISGYLVQENFWRINFLMIGLAILLAGFNVNFIIKEPKRGIQNEELKDVLKYDSVEYNFKLNKETLRNTIFSKTNIAAFIEGVFTNVYMGSLQILILPYLQTPPHNFSPFLTGIFLVLFGLSGGLLGQILLAKLSDRLSSKNHKRRLDFIIISLIGGSITFTLLFFVPLPNLLFSSFAISSLYGVNQPPLLQDINLPEAQGTITSWNQFLENIGYGMGPLISGILISFFSENYQVISIIISLFVIPGVILWICAYKWYTQDKKTVSKILKERSRLLSKEIN
ncbi:MAG: MFS transporter [Promethearchaeota archaeon]